MESEPLYSVTEIANRLKIKPERCGCMYVPGS